MFIMGYYSAIKRNGPKVHTAQIFLSDYSKSKKPDIKEHTLYKYTCAK